MHCPNPDCSGPRMMILESRYSGDRQNRRRRYECPECSYRYASMERLVRVSGPAHCKPNS